MLRPCIGLGTYFQKNSFVKGGTGAMRVEITNPFAVRYYLTSRRNGGKFHDGAPGHYQ